MAIENLNENVMVVVRKGDLVEFALSLMDEAKKAKENEEKKEKLLSPDDVCREYKVSLSTLWRWQKSGVLIPKKIGARSLYKESEVKAFFFS